MGQRLEHRQPSRTKNAEELADVGLDDLHRRHVLDDQRRIDEVERVGLELSEIRRGVDQEPAVRPVLVQLARELHHAFRDVERDALAKPLPKGPTEPADATAEVERPLAAHRFPEVVRDLEHLRDLGLPGREELGQLPAAAPAIGGGQDRPERVDLRELLPLLLVPAQDVGANGHR